MMKLIDADILKSHAKDVTLQNGAKHRCIDSTIICELPKVEIVRCKDCRFGYISKFAPPEKRDIWCCAENHILATVKPDFFCADAEQKGGEQDA